MSFREKSAWVTLTAIIIVSAMYLFHVRRVFEASHWAFMAMLASLGAFVLIEVVAVALLALRNPTEARTPKDELEKLIELKALRIAAYVYFVGSFGAAFITIHHLHAHAHVLGASLLLAFIVAEIVNYSVRIVYYRRHA